MVETFAAAVLERMAMFHRNPPTQIGQPPLTIWRAEDHIKSGVSRLDPWTVSLTI